MSTVLSKEIVNAINSSESIGLGGEGLEWTPPKGNDNNDQVVLCERSTSTSLASRTRSSRNVWTQKVRVIKREDSWSIDLDIAIIDTTLRWMYNGDLTKFLRELVEE